MEFLNAVILIFDLYLIFITRELLARPVWAGFNGHAIVWKHRKSILDMLFLARIQISDSNRNPICIYLDVMFLNFLRIIDVIWSRSSYFWEFFSPPRGNERWEGKNSIKHCFNGQKQRNYFCAMSILTVIWYFVCLSDYCKFWFYIRSRFLCPTYCNEWMVVVF